MVWDVTFLGYLWVSGWFANRAGAYTVLLGSSGPAHRPILQLPQTCCFSASSEFSLWTMTTPYQFWEILSMSEIFLHCLNHHAPQTTHFNLCFIQHKGKNKQVAAQLLWLGMSTVLERWDVQSFPWAVAEARASPRTIISHFLCSSGTTPTLTQVNCDG